MRLAREALSEEQVNMLCGSDPSLHFDIVMKAIIELRDQMMSLKPQYEKCKAKIEFITQMMV